MKIAVIAADLTPERLGGAESHVVEVSKRLAKKGHQIVIFAGHDTRIIKILPQNITVHTVNYPKITNLYGLSYIVFAPSRIKKRLKEIEIDLLWATQVFPQAVTASLIKKQIKKPLYVTAQNPFAYKEELVIKGPIPFKRQLPELLKPLIKTALKNSDLVAAVSNYSKQQADHLGAKKVMLIPNGIDTKRFEKLQKSTKESKKAIFVTTSALIPRNGVDLLIKAVSLLPEKVNWELIIAGDGPQYKNLKSQILKLKLEDKVKMLGRVDNKDIPQLLKNSDIFIRLSRWEGFGVSFAEAMAAGIPVIATSVGGITDFVIQEKTGLLVESENPKQAASAILQLLSNKRLANNLSKNASKLVKTKYTWENIADEVEKAFKSMV